MFRDIDDVELLQRFARESQLDWYDPWGDRATHVSLEELKTEILRRMSPVSTGYVER